jgi:hypothetical protein
VKSTWSHFNTLTTLFAQPVSLISLHCTQLSPDSSMNNLHRQVRVLLLAMPLRPILPASKQGSPISMNPRLCGELEILTGFKICSTNRAGE